MSSPLEVMKDKLIFWNSEIQQTKIDDEWFNEQINILNGAPHTLKIQKLQK